MTGSFLGSLYYFFLTSLRLAKTNVISNGILKEIDALEDKAEITNQAVIAIISNIMSVQTDTSLVHIPEAGNEVAERCFA